MSLGKVITLGILAVLFLQYLKGNGEQLEMLKSLYPVLQTHMEMGSYRTGLSRHLSSTDGHSLPHDMHAWLNENYEWSRKPPGIDPFGSPYQSDFADDRPVLRSCGPDRACQTTDDILTRF